MMAGLVAAGVSEATYNTVLFRTIVNLLKELRRQRRGEPERLVANKGYFGATGSDEIVLVTHIANRDEDS
jgi:hypothetical protein